MQEITINLHMHTPYSDGYCSHTEIARAAIKTGLDAVIITDHNVWVEGLEGYYEEEEKRVLVLVGEEVHDQARQPQKNHLLVFGANREMNPLAADPQLLIDSVIRAGGLAFLAHPIDPEALRFNQEDLSWVNWDVHNYTGIELWNAMSEFKSHLQGYPQALFYAFNFDRVAHGPFPDTLRLWDELLEKGRKVVAIGGSDAHQLTGNMGPLKKVLFPFEKHFTAVNTHLLIPEPLSGDLTADRQMILDALRSGHAFVGYDLPAPTRGFRFTAHCAERDYIMGDAVSAQESVTLQVKLPHPTQCHLLKDGEIVRSSMKRTTFVYSVKEPGVYRVEAYIHFKGKRRGWIFSNPIYVR